MAKRQHNNLKWIVLTAALLLLGVATAFALNIPGLSKYEKVKSINGAVSIPVADLAGGKANYYRFTDGGKEIRFFVVKATDGTIKTAYDACDVCYQEKKGYEQNGDKMVCKNCNMKFATTRIGPHAVGGCNPSYLPGKQVGTNIVITVNDLKAGERYF